MLLVLPSTAWREVRDSSLLAERRVPSALPPEEAKPKGQFYSLLHMQGKGQCVSPHIFKLPGVMSCTFSQCF